MSEPSETIALIEIGGSHDECLLTQMMALRETGHAVVLVCNREIWDRNPAFSEYVDETYFVFDAGTENGRFSEMRRILRFMEEQGVARAVLNTAQGAKIRDLCALAIFSPIEFVGILHTTRKMKGSFTQRIINRKVRKYFFLSEYLLSTVKAPARMQLDYFYPVCFASTPTIIEKRHRVMCIIGGVEKRRKDLEGFLRMATQAEDSWHFIFLGKSDPANPDVADFQRQLDELQLVERVHTYDHFVDQQEFDAVLQNADAILPLIHPDTPSADQYFRNQISGAMTVAFGYGIPLFVHEAYAHIEEMQGASFYYTLANFAEVVRGADLGAKRAEMAMLPACNPEIQKERFRKLLFTP